MTALLDVFKAHCFWGWCDHIVTGFGSEKVSREMQEHYDEKHSDDLVKLGYGATREYLRAKKSTEEAK